MFRWNWVFDRPFALLRVKKMMSSRGLVFEIPVFIEPNHHQNLSLEDSDVLCAGAQCPLQETLRVLQ